MKTFLNNYWKKGISMLCVIMLLVTVSTSSVSAAIQQDSTTLSNSEQNVQVLIYEDENESIYAEVPKSKVDEYKKDLKNSSFLHNEVQKARGNNVSTKEVTTYGSCGGTTTKYFNKNAVIDTLEHMERGTNWSRLLSNPISDPAVAAATKLLTKSNLLSVIATATTWAAGDLMGRQTAYWKDSAIMILKGKIRGVKLTIKPNCTSNYPAVYKKYTRY